MALPDFLHLGSFNEVIYLTGSLWAVYESCLLIYVGWITPQYNIAYILPGPSVVFTDYLLPVQIAIPIMFNHWNHTYYLKSPICDVAFIVVKMYEKT